MTFFDTRNGFPGSGRGSGRIKVYKRMLTGSPLLSPPPPPTPLYSYLLAFSLTCNIREPGTGYFSLYQEPMTLLNFR